MRSQGNPFLHSVTSMGEATATATYGDFKRFETSATISVK
jgi:hypothetical protein